MDDVATLEQTLFPTGLVDVLAKHHGIALAAIDVLEHALLEQRGCIGIARQDGGRQMAFDGLFGR